MSRAANALMRIDPHGPYSADLIKLKDELTPEEFAFTNEYLVDFDGMQAALRAGLTVKDGRRFLGRRGVQRAIALYKSARADRLAVSAEKVIQELAKIGFANMDDYLRYTPDGDPIPNLDALDRDRAAALSEVVVEDYVDGRGENARQVKRVKFKLHDKRAALESLGRCLGMFVDRVRLEGDVEIRIKAMTRDERMQLVADLLAPMKKYLAQEELAGQDIEHQEDEEIT